MDTPERLMRRALAHLEGLGLDTSEWALGGGTLLRTEVGGPFLVAGERSSRVVREVGNALGGPLACRAFANLGGEGITVQKWQKAAVREPCRPFWDLRDVLLRVDPQ